MRNSKITSDTGVSVVVMMIFGLVTMGGMLAAMATSGYPPAGISPMGG